MSNVVYAIPCQFCKAEAGEPCVTKTGQRAKGVHAIRAKEAVLLEAEHVRSGDPAGIPIPHDGPEVPVEPEVQLAFECKQVAQVIFDKGERLTRTPRPADTAYDANRYFGASERRAYMERFAPCEYVTCTIDDPELAMKVIVDGLEEIEASVDIFDSRVVTGWTKDGEGVTFVMTPFGVQAGLKGFGVREMLRSSRDIGKFMKYLRRLMSSSYMHSSVGTRQTFSADEHGPYLDFWNEDQAKKFRIRYDAPLPIDPNTGKALKKEGDGAVSPRFANEFFGEHPDRGGKWAVGDTCRITFTCNDFMWKGHIMIWPFADVDAAFYDCKKIIGTEEVFIGMMGSLHSGKLKLSLQAVNSYGLEGPLVDYATNEAIRFSKAVQDPAALKALFMSMAEDRLDQLNDEESPLHQQISKWRATSAYYHGFDVASEPVLQRDLFRQYERAVLDLTEGKVAVPETDGRAAYAFLDPWMYTDQGLIDLSKRRLMGRSIYHSNLPAGQEVVLFRHPNTRHEFRIATTVGPEKMFSMIDPNVMIVSVDFADEFMDWLGGCDFDDLICMIWKPAIVDHFKYNLPEYPERMSPSVVQKTMDWLETNIIARARGLDRVTFGVPQIKDQIQASLDNEAGIGMIVNWLMTCHTISVHHSKYVAWAEAGMAAINLKDPKLTLEQARAHDTFRRALDWLKGYTRYHENFVASALEDAIDGCVMRGSKGMSTDYSKLGQTIRNFWDGCDFVPFWATTGGYQGEGRIPGRIRKAKPVVCDVDPLSQAMHKLADLKIMLDDVVNAQQWLGLQMAKPEIRSYPVTKEVIDAVTNGEKSWAKSMATRRAGKALDSKESYKSFLAICENHKKAMENRTHEFRMMFMAELERRVHNGPHGSAPTREDENGRMRPVGVKDAYLNNPSFFGYRIQLYKELGLTRELHYIKLDQDVLADHGIRIGRQQLFEAYDSQILLVDPEGEVAISGYDPALPNGVYSMENSMIRLGANL